MQILNSNKLLGSLKHVINIIMWIRYTGCCSALQDLHDWAPIALAPSSDRLQYPWHPALIIGRQG
jgi:hypothetical protein